MLCVIVAHKREARDIIRTLHLSQLSPRHFANHSVHVYISGQGIDNAKAAMTYLYAQMPAHTLWLNYGIAGHAIRPIGEHVLVSAVHGPQGEAIPLTTAYDTCLPAIARSELRSVDVVKDYLHDTLQDMELWGLVDELLLQNEMHKLMSIKVISDNVDAPIARLDKNTMEGILKKSLPFILTCINRIVAHQSLIQLNQLGNDK